MSSMLVCPRSITMSAQLRFIPTRRHDRVHGPSLRYLATYAPSIPELQANAKQFRAYASRATYEDQDREVAIIPVDYTTKSHRLFTDRDVSLQNLDRAIRANLVLPSAIDLDFTNCAPAILLQVAKNRFPQEEFPAMTAFASDSDPICSAINAHGTAHKDTKCFILNSPNEARLHCKDRDLGEHRQAFDDLINELINFAEILGKTTDFRAMWREAEEADRQKDTKRARKDRVSNVHGIFLARVYFQHETLCLRALDAAGKRAGLWDDNVTLVFDGMIIHNPLLPIDGNTLRNLSRDIYNETHIRLRIKNKPFGDKLIPNINEPPEKMVFTDGEDESSRIFITAMEGQVYKSENTLYACVDGVWTCEPDTVKAFLIHKALSMDIRRLVYNKKEDEMEEQLYSKILRNAQAMVTACAQRWPSKPLFSRELVLNSKGKIAFPNGYWQFTNEIHPETGCYGYFVPGGSFPTGVMMDRPFRPPVPEDIDTFMTTIINPAFVNTEGLKENYLRALGRACAGEVDKVTSILEGPRNSSKSLQAQALRYSFGNYTTSIPSAFLCIKTNSMNDAWRDNSWIFDIEHARMAFISETAQTNRGEVVFSGDMLKKFQSAKEGVSGRKIRQNQREAVSLASGFMMVNDIPTFEPVDAIEKCHIYTLPNRFVNQAEINEHPFSSHYLLADPAVETFIREDKYRDALMHIVFQAYHPQPVEPTEGMKGVVELFLENTGAALYEQILEITLDMSDKVSMKDLKTAVAKVDAHHAKNSIKREIIQLIMDKFKQEKPGQPVPTEQQIYTLVGNGHQAGRARGIAGVRLLEINHGGDNGFANGFMP